MVVPYNDHDHAADQEADKRRHAVAPPPGPWTVTDLSPHWARLVVSITPVAFTHEHYGPTEESRERVLNIARLMAAAPDMLEALIRALPFIETAVGDPHYKQDSVKAVLRLVREAIDKAEGSK